MCEILNIHSGMRRCLMYLLHLVTVSVPKSLNALHKLCLVLRVYLPPDVFLHLVPQIFYGVCIRGLSRRFHPVNVASLNEFPGV